jgi:hypothetical protein
MVQLIRIWRERPSMAKIYIAGLDESPLIELNAHIVEPLQFLRHQRTAAALEDISAEAARKSKALAASRPAVASSAATGRQ